MNNVAKKIEAILLSTLTLLVAGCGTGLSHVAESVPQGGGSAIVVNGSFHGGQQPIVGATVQLYAVGTRGLYSPATPLIGTTVVTDANGGFNIAGKWDCTSNTNTYGVNPLIYIVGTGGNPGLGGTVNNTASALMAAIGPCSSFTSTSYVSVNELTTVAATFALAPFMGSYAQIGASGTNAPGLVNAFQTASLLVNPSSGTMPGPNLPTNATMPTSEIATLADILSLCVNSNGTDGNCAAVFAAAKPSGGSTPANTIAAALDIAQNPGNNVTQLFNLAPATGPYQPLLPQAPNDWTVAVNYTGGGLNSPGGLAVDASGNIWVANAGGNSVTELSNTGALLTGSAGYTGSGNILGAQAIAVDRTGNVWVADTLLSSVVKLTLSSGIIQSNASYTAGGIDGPTALALDSHSNVWVSNFAGASVTELNSSGVAVGGSPLTANGTLRSPFGIAGDLAGNMWVTDNAGSNVAEFSNSQTLLSGAGYTDGSMIAPEGIGIDTSGEAWIADNGVNSVSLLSPNGAASPYSPLHGGGLSMPAAVAVDGNGAIWVVNSTTNGSLTKLSATQGTAISPSTGYGVLHAPDGVAVDPSGSVWTANSGDSSVSEFVGIAGPAPAPLAILVGP
ncbi:Streptogramin lyase [Granulicella rosea]|uniref:Streptogramin lyase n=1 Tax=Granulicella rosea TaxID=474952 RepID=A0A239GUZ9_9BACT|nr:NHL repeat-containing protein [Granulicella rosea]SNS72333.1 Streptogramin lyase [Granulicella rosea]